jgi:hypothetical protein
MDVLLWLARWVLGPILALVVTLLLSEPLKNRLAPLVAKLGSKREVGVTGQWKATFTYGPSDETFVEAIEISSLFGVFVGRVIPHADTYPELKRNEKSKPLRLRGEVKDNRYFTGVWFHPLRRSHFHGAFELLIHQNGEQMNGMWLGYSERKNTIESGDWTWERLDDGDTH